MKTVLKLIETILALPKIGEQIMKLIALLQVYLETRAAEKLRKQYKDALKKAMEENDTRALEESLGSPRAGEPSGYAGSSHRTSISGVSDDSSSERD